MVIMAGSLLLQGLMYILLNAIGGIELFHTVIDKLMLPGSGEVFIYQPWSIVTYPFFQHPRLVSLMTILVTFMFIWMFGRIHQQILGDQRTRRFVILVVPVIAIMTVLLSSLLAMSTSNQKVELVGEAVKQEQFVESTPIEEKSDVAILEESSETGEAETTDSAENPSSTEGDNIRETVPFSPYAYGFTFVLVALIASAISKVPDYPVNLMLLGRVKILWVGVVIIGMEFFIAMINPAMSIGILLAAGLGFFHIYMMKQGVDLTENVWSYYQDKNVKPKMKVKYGSPKPNPAKRHQARPRSELSQEIIDGILDKISAQGYESLSREEKEILFRASSDKKDES